MVPFLMRSCFSLSRGDLGDRPFRSENLFTPVMMRGLQAFDSARTPKFQREIIFTRRRGDRGGIFVNGGTQKLCTFAHSIIPLDLPFSGSTNHAPVFCASFGGVFPSPRSALRNAFGETPSSRTKHRWMFRSDENPDSQATSAIVFSGRARSRWACSSRTLSRCPAGDRRSSERNA